MSNSRIVVNAALINTVQIPNIGDLGKMLRGEGNYERTLQDGMITIKGKSPKGINFEVQVSAVSCSFIMLLPLIQEATVAGSGAGGGGQSVTLTSKGK